MKNQVWIRSVYSIGSEVPDSDMGWLKQRKFLKVMDAGARNCLQAVHSLLQNSGETISFGGESCGVVVSLGSVNSGVTDWKEARASLLKNQAEGSFPAEKTGSALPPLSLIPRLPNSIAGHVAREFGATGPCWTSGMEDFVGLDALVQGIRWIVTRECEQVLVARAETKGALALLLESKDSPGTREILSWTEGVLPDGKITGRMLQLSDLKDWKTWQSADELRSGRGNAGIGIVLKSA